MDRRARHRWTTGIAAALTALAFLPAANAAAAGWVNRTDLAVGPSSAPRAAMAPDGTAFVTWSGSDGVGRVSVRPPGGNWATTDLEATGDPVAIGVAGDGTATALVTGNSRTTIDEFRRTPGGGWQSAGVVYYADTDDNGQLYAPSLAVNAGGEAIASWQERIRINNDPGCRTADVTPQLPPPCPKATPRSAATFTTSYTRWADVRSGGSWTGVSAVAEPNPSAPQSVAAIGDNGRGVLAYDNPSGQPVAVVRDPGGGVPYGDTVLSSGGGTALTGRPRVSPSGDVFVPNVSGGNVAVAVARSGSGFEQRPLTAGSGPAGVSVGPDGTFSVSYVDGNGNTGIVTEGLASGSTPVATLATGSGSTQPGGVVPDPTGGQSVAWLAGNGTVSAARRGSSTGAFEAVQTLGAGGSDVLSAPIVAGDGQGDLVIAWAQASGNSPQVAVFDGSPPRLSGLSFPSSLTVGTGGTFSVAASDPMSGVSLSWAFGDGGSAGGSPVGHAYGSAGTFGMTVTATDGVGNSSSAGGKVTVTSPAPVAGPDPAPAPTPTTPPAGGTPTPPTGGMPTTPPTGTTGTTGATGKGGTLTKSGSSGSRGSSSGTSITAGEPAGSDNDHDGSKTPADCDDTNAKIHPGAKEIAGNKVDEDCSGSATPYGTIALSTLLSWDRLSSGRTRLTGLRVSGVKVGDHVTVTCTGSGCRKPRTHRIVLRKVRGRVLSLTSMVRQTLGAKARLTVTVSRKNAVTRRIRYTMVQHHDPSKASECQAPGATRARRC